MLNTTSDDPSAGRGPGSWGCPVGWTVHAAARVNHPLGRVDAGGVTGRFIRLSRFEWTARSVGWFIRLLVRVSGAAPNPNAYGPPGPAGGRVHGRLTVTADRDADSDADSDGAAQRESRIAGPIGGRDRQGHGCPL